MAGNLFLVSYGTSLDCASLTFLEVCYLMTLSLIQVNCDTAPWVREKKPVFCEKRTEIVDGVYVTTRGCSIDYRSSHANISFKFICVWRSVLRIRINADPDPTFHFNADPVPTFHLKADCKTFMRIRIRILTLMRKRKKIRPSSKLCKFAITGLQTLHGSIVTRELPRLYCEPHPLNSCFLGTEINNSFVNLDPCVTTFN